MNKIIKNIYIIAILANHSLYAMNAKYELQMLSLRNRLGLPYNSPLSNDEILNQAIDAFQTSKPDYIKPALCGHIRSISNYDNLEESRGIFKKIFRTRSFTL